MGSTYTRQSSTEIVDGEVIQASDFNNEFEQLVSAFAVSTGHSHDGTTAEGGPVTKLLGTAITIGDGTAGTDIAVTFDGETSDGVLTWMEDEDHFKFSDDVVIDSSKRIYLYDEGGEYIYGDGTDLYLVSGADINIPANIGVTFGNDGEKIEGDGTDLTISGNNINLTATADVVIPADVGITFGTGEKIEGNSTDLTITSGADINLTATSDVNIPSGVGVTFGDDGEKIEGDGTDLTIAGNNINLTATADVVIPADVGITFGSGEKIEGDSTDLTVTSGAKINLSATSDVVIPSGVGLILDGSGNEKIESDGTDISISVGSGGDINIPADIGVTFGDDGEKIEGDGTDLTISASALFNVDAGTDIVLDADGGDIFFKDGGTTFGSATNTSGNLIIKSGTTTALTFSGANVTGAGTYTGGGLMTTGGNIVIPNAGNIGSVSDTDAIAISSGGVVTFSQNPVFPDGGTDIADLDIDGGTDIGADLTTSDLIIVDDGAGGTNRKAALSRINTLVQTAGGFPLTALDIDGGTDIGEAIVDADLFIIDNGAGGTNRKTAASRLKTYIASSAADPSSADGDSLGTASLEWSDLYLADGGIIYFGNDQEITLTHVADDGLILKHVGTGDGKEPSLTFQAGDNDIAVNDVLGSIFFQAPDEGAGTDAILVAAGIEAVSEGNFATDNNATKLSFKTAASEAASEKMSLSSAGLLTVADDIVFKDGGTIGVSSATDAMTVSSAGIVTFVDDILIKDGGTIGVASAATAITIASTGIVTFVDDILIKDAGTIGSASDPDAISISSGGVVNVSATTANTSASDGALTVAGGVGIAADLSVGDDLRLISDDAVLSFGANSEVTVTHVHNTGLLLNSTMQLQFNDASQYINAPSATVLDINATDEIELNATLADVNANLDVSGTYTGGGLMTTGGNIVIPNAGNIGSASDTDAIAISSGGVVTFSQNPVFPNGGIDVADLDIDGATDIGEAIVDADLFIIDNGAGGTNRKTVASRLPTYLFGNPANLTAGYSATTYNAGTKSSGTFTPDQDNANLQYAVNGGAHTLAPTTDNCTVIIQYTNNASAGTITTSGFTQVTGDSLTTTNGHDFFMYLIKNNGFSQLHVTALQ